MKVMSSDKKKVYEVTQTSCTCSDFTYRQARVGGKCKHILKCFGEINVSSNDIEELGKPFKNGLDINEAYKQIGDDKIKQMIEARVIIKSPKIGDNKFYLLE